VKESHKQKQKGESIFPKIKKRELVREKITHIQKHFSTYQLTYPYNTKTLTHFFKRGHHPHLEKKWYSFPLSQPYTQH